MDNIYLVGMMGSGKTVTGEALADLTGMKFLDLDSEIEKKTRLSINQIFRDRDKGEPYFRTVEKKILNEIAGRTGFVIATGGGIVLDQENIEKMKITGQVISLNASFDTLWNRVKDKADRPLLYVDNPEKKFFQIFQERTPFYQIASDGRIVQTDGLTPQATARMIVEQYLK